MKAVNQSVGRAIRHKEDYAAILFLDHRLPFCFKKTIIFSQVIFKCNKCAFSRSGSKLVHGVLDFFSQVFQAINHLPATIVDIKTFTSGR